MQRLIKENTKNKRGKIRQVEPSELCRPTTCEMGEQNLPKKTLIIVYLWESFGQVVLKSLNIADWMLSLLPCPIHIYLRPVNVTLFGKEVFAHLV